MRRVQIREIENSKPPIDRSILSADAKSVKRGSLVKIRLT